MPFSICSFRRFPVCCPVTYQCGLFEGHGTVWNLSLGGLAVLWQSAAATRGIVFAHGEPADSTPDLYSRWDRSMGPWGGVWG